jgi:cytochrome c55X
MSPIERKEIDLKRAWRFGLIAAATIVVLACAGPVATPTLSGASPDFFRQTELRRVVLQDCSTCHGMRLTGGVGPPLTPQALTGKPPEALVSVIVHGRHPTPMPAWASQISEAEAAWIADRLLDGTIDLP